MMCVGGRVDAEVLWRDAGYVCGRQEGKQSLVKATLRCEETCKRLMRWVRFQCLVNFKCFVLYETLIIAMEDSDGTR